MDHDQTGVTTSLEDTTLVGEPEALCQLPADGLPPRLGRYVPLSMLGAGGMGQVYAAYDTELARPRLQARQRDHRPSRAGARARLWPGDRRGELTVAREYFAQALAILEDPDDDASRQLRANTLNNLGNADARMGELPRARAHLEAAASRDGDGSQQPRRGLADPRRASGGDASPSTLADNPLVAFAATNLGLDYLADGQALKAIEHLKDAIEAVYAGA